MKAIVLSLVALLSFMGNAWADNSYGLKDNIQDGVILHCFDWKLSDIKAALPEIAKAGFTAVQTSPLQRNVSTSSTWYDAYRPYDFKFIASDGLGSKEDLQSLCAEADKYGVKIVVDVVFNHVDGSSGNKTAYHDSWWNGGDYLRWYGDVNYGNRNSITHNQMGGGGGYPDVNSENSDVQARAKAYIEELKSCGVDGIRFDAAKHIGLPSEGCNFWPTVTSVSGLWYYGEILDGTGGDDSKLLPEYQKYISITDNVYGNNFAGSFNSGSVNSSIGNFNQKGAATAKLVYWGESHDTYANDGGSSKNMSQNVIDRAYAVVAGNNEATALYFSRPSSTDKNSMKLGQKGSTHFTSTEVAEVNHLHNICAGEPNYYVHEGNVAAQVRNSGAVIVLGNGSNQRVNFKNGAGDGKWLTTGTYTDKIGGGTFTVTSSTISGQVGSTGIAVLYGAPSNDAGVTVSPEGGVFTTDTKDVTLTPNANTTSYWYQVGDGEKTTVSANTTSTVTIGAGVDYGTDITLSWGAANSKGKEKTGSVTFTKRDPNAAVSVFVQSSTAPYIYVWYTDASNNVVEPNGSWETMKEMPAYTTGWYVYTAPEGVSSINFILTTKAGASDADKLTDDIKDVTSDVYYKVSDGTASVTDNRPGNDNSFEPELESADENCVFLESSTKSYIYAFSTANTAIVGAWPGAQMTKVGETSAGVPVYKYTFSANQMTDMPSETESTGSAGIIFNDGNGHQTDNLSFHNRGYYVDGAFTKTITKVKSTPTAIISLNRQTSEAHEGYYTLSGIRLKENPTRPGVYIRSGKKIVIR